MLIEDDIIITGNNSVMLKEFVRQLNSIFALKDLGCHYHFLGIETYRDTTGLYLKQENCILELLKKCGMTNCSPVPTPMVVNKLLSIDGVPLANPTTYRHIIGALQYLINIKLEPRYLVCSK